MPSLQELLLTQEPSSSIPEARITEILPKPAIEDASIHAIVSILSAHSGRFLKNAASRNQLREKCTTLCGLKNSANAVIANLELGIESIERLIEERGNGRSDLKIKSLRNAIRLLSVASDVKSRRRLRGSGGSDGGDFTGGVANTHLSACAHLYLSIVCKIERKDRASARHILQVFYDAPYLARKSLLPELWNHFFIPHLLHLKVWFAKEVGLISDWDVEFKEQRIKSLERAYNDQMDVGTSQFAQYYKEWITVGAEAPPLPSVNLPSVAVSRNMYNSVVSLSLERENVVDARFVHNEEVEAKDDAEIYFHTE